MATGVGWIETVVQILPFVEKLLGEDPSTMQYALTSIGHSHLGIAIYHRR